MPPWSFSQPERINPELNQKGYNVKSDVWSLGITMVPGWACGLRGARSVGEHLGGCQIVQAPGESVGFTLKRAPSDGLTKGVAAVVLTLPGGEGPA